MRFTLIGGSFLKNGAKNRDRSNGLPHTSYSQFLQSRFDDGLAASTIKVYVAAISARHNR